MNVFVNPVNELLFILFCAQKRKRKKKVIISEDVIYIFFNMTKIINFFKLHFKFEKNLHLKRNAYINRHFK